MAILEQVENSERRASRDDAEGVCAGERGFVYVIGTTNGPKKIGVPHDIALNECQLEGRYEDEWKPVEHAHLQAVFAAVKVGFMDGRLAIQGR